MAFQLDSTLARDSVFICDYPLCQIRLMDNRCFPWLLMIPRRENLREWIDLERSEQHQCSDEITMISHVFQALVTPHKLNIAMLGNQVPQLHIHVIGRYPDDACWPNPVWGGPREYYAEEDKTRFVRELKMAFESAL